MDKTEKLTRFQVSTVHVSAYSSTGSKNCPTGVYIYVFVTSSLRRSQFQLESLTVTASSTDVPKTPGELGYEAGKGISLMVCRAGVHGLLALCYGGYWSWTSQQCLIFHILLVHQLVIAVLFKIRTEYWMLFSLLQRHQARQHSVGYEWTYSPGWFWLLP